MTFYTERLVLRSWEISDAEKLFEYGSDVSVGPMAGWPPHTSVENSKEIIATVLSDALTYAIAFKDSPHDVIGSIGIRLIKGSVPLSAEVGYWIGVPFWGKGIVPEALKRLLAYCFEELNVEEVWCGYYEGNNKSKRVQEKIGFNYDHTEDAVYVPLLDACRVEHFTKMTKKDYENHYG